MGKTERNHKKKKRLKWQPPELKPLGSLKDVVQGGGKTGPTADGDPQSTRKTGIG